MSTVAWHASRWRNRRPQPKAYCELDDWTFDPRYTEGRCPICGWVAPNAPNAPVWLTLARRFEWELGGLLVLLAVLILLAVGVIHAAGYKVPWLGAPVHAAPVSGAASQARTSPHTSASPSMHVSASPSKKP